MLLLKLGSNPEEQSKEGSVLSGDARNESINFKPPEDCGQRRHVNCSLLVCASLHTAGEWFLAQLGETARVCSLIVFGSGPPFESHK
jgi:hypothetical protein